MLRSGLFSIFLTIVSLLASVGSSQAENLYKFNKGDLAYSPYQDAILALTFGEDAVSGQLRPLLGDDTSPVNVSGTQPREGFVELTFDFAGGPETLGFKKRVTGTKIIWEVVNRESGIWFYRYLDSPLPDAALTLTDYECGARYRTLGVDFRSGVTIDQLDKFLTREPAAASMTVSYDNYDDTGRWIEGKSTTLGIWLRNNLTKNLTKGETIWFDTPVGVEPYIAKLLRGSGLVKKVDFDIGGCGGADRSYFVISRDLLFDANGFSEQKFEQYIDQRLPTFVQKDDRGSSWAFRLGPRRVSRVNVPPYPSSYQIKLYVASEITRHVSGWWDSFSVSFEPGELMDTKKSEYAVVVTVERLKASKRSLGNDSPPDDSYYTKELSDFDEAEVTAAVSRYFSKRDDGWCIYETEGYERKKHHSVCDLSSE